MPASFTLPQPDEFADTLTRRYHAEFMHSFYALAGKTGWQRVSEAIRRAAENTGSAEEAVARGLVECGLRAPREFLPEKFVNALERTARDPDVYRARLSNAQKELLRDWKAAPRAAGVFLFSGRMVKTPESRGVLRFQGL
jgi:hypothetical protein